MIPPTQRMIRQALIFLIKAGVRAPSGDNIQPWRFTLDPITSRMALALEPSEDNDLMNPNNSMGRVSLGAALENIVRTARYNNWTVHFENPHAGYEIMLKVSAIGSPPYQVENVVQQRTTNRRFYQRKALPGDLFNQLNQKIEPMANMKVLWMTDRTRIQKIASLLQTVDMLLFSDLKTWKKFLSRIRFDLGKSPVIEKGLSLPSLEVNHFERWSLTLAAHFPQLSLNLTGANGLIGQRTRKLTLSSAGLALIMASDFKPLTDISVGRIFEQTWLALTELDLAVQPMTSICALYTILCCSSPERQKILGRVKLEKIIMKLRQLVPELGSQRPAILLRFGYSERPSDYTERLPLAEVVTEKSLA